MARCQHPPVDDLLEQLEATSLTTACTWPAWSGLRCSRQASRIINYFGEDPRGIPGIVMAATCDAHARPITSFAAEKVQAAHVHSFPLDELPDQLASFHAGSRPPCATEAMHWVTSAGQE